MLFQNCANALCVFFFLSCFFKGYFAFFNDCNHICISDNIVRCTRSRKDGICNAVIGCSQPPKNGQLRVSLSECVEEIIIPARDPPSLDTIMKNPKRYKKFMDSYYKHAHPEFMDTINAAILLANCITVDVGNPSTTPTPSLNEDDPIATTSNEDISMATMPNDDAIVGSASEREISIETISSTDIPIGTVLPTPRGLITSVHERTPNPWLDPIPGPSNQQFNEYAREQSVQIIDPSFNQNNDTLDDLMSITANPMMSNYSPPNILEQTTFENIVNNLFDDSNPIIMDEVLQLPTKKD